MYNEIRRPETIKGIKYWKNPNNRFNVITTHYTADPEKDPDRQGKEWFDNERKGVPLHSWNKEYEIDFNTKSGKLVYGREFCDYDENIHCIPSFEFQDPQEFLFSLDFGQRNPTAGLVGVWTPKNKLYIVDEYYKPALPSVSSREMMQQFKHYFNGNIDGKSMGEKRNIIDSTFQVKVIDPTTRSKNRTKTRQGEEIEYSVIEEFYDHGWDFTPGINAVEAGITRVREYMQINPSDGEPSLYIFKDKCPNLILELRKYRYKENTEQQAKTKNESEEVVKKNDHAVDALRMMVMTRPISPTQPEKELTRIQKDIKRLLTPQNVPSFWDID